MGLLLFVVGCLNKKRGRLDAMGGRLADAGSALCHMMHVFDRAGPRLTAMEINQCWHFWQRYCTLTQDLPELHIPNRHIILHMLDQLEHRGNPRYYSSWLGESLNKLLKGACRSLSQLTFEAVLLVNMEHLLANGGRKEKTQTPAKRVNGFWLSAHARNLVARRVRVRRHNRAIRVKIEAEREHLI